MDEAQVMMLVAASAAVKLPPDLEKLAETEEFWESLEGATDESLSADQRAMLDALGVGSIDPD